MRKQKTQLPEMTLLGITARTNNKNEMNSQTSKIAQLAGLYWSNQVANHIQHRREPGVTYAVYTEFESDEHGDYTYFIGEAVDSLENQDLEKFKALTIPKSHYRKFTTDKGKIPEVIISAWQEIWAMKKSDFGGKRKYRADFEVYDERAMDPNNAIVDIYIGIEE